MNKLSVLVVDDDERCRKDASNAVDCYLMDSGQKQGYGRPAQIYQADTAEKGLAMLDQKPDLVILDINFNPDQRNNQDGLIRFLSPCRQAGNAVPVICWSRDNRWKWDAREAGADEFVTKGDSYELQCAIRFILGRKNH